MSWGSLSVYISDGTITFNDHGAYESRNSSTIQLIREAWNLYPPKTRISKQLIIHTEDGFSDKADFSYAITSQSNLSKCVPSFIFDCWPEVGIQNYEETFQQMIKAGEVPPTDNRVFWIGANTNSLRKHVCELAPNYRDYVDFRMMSWNRTDPSALYKHTGTYVSLLDHCKYRVLIDLGAGGFSARLPLLLASGRPLILAERKFENWFYWDGTLQPWLHYIPGGSTADSIYNAVKWTFEHPEEAARIGVRGQEYAKVYLTHAAAVKQYADLLWVR